MPLESAFIRIMLKSFRCREFRQIPAFTIAIGHKGQNETSFTHRGISCFIIKNTIKTRGDDMAEKKKLKIVGANCGDCDSSIKGAVMKISGVKKIRVSCKAGSGEVEYDPDKTHIVEIVKAIRGTGHECRVKVI